MITEMEKKIAEILPPPIRIAVIYLCISVTIFAQIADLAVKISIPSSARGIIPSGAR